MADGGLPTLNPNATQSNMAGLGDDPVMTMRDRENTLEALRQYGLAAPAPAAGETMADDAGVGLGGEIAYGARRAAEGALQGAGDLLGDRMGWEGGRDALYGVGEWAGPSDAQEEAQARQAASPDRTILGETADMITQEAAPTALPVALATGGAMVGGPLGAAIGGAAGFAFNYLRFRDETRDKAKEGKAKELYGDTPTQEQIDGVELSGSDLNKVDAVAAAGSALDTITPLKVLRRLKPGRAAQLGEEVVKRGLAKAAGRKLTADALSEGATEVAQSALQEIVFDPELQRHLSEDERGELLTWVGKTYGKEVMQTFAVGGAIGGGMGAASGAYEQKIANQKRANDVRVLTEAGQTAGVDVSALESAVADPEKVGQVVTDADEMRAADARLRSAQEELDAYAAQPEEDRNPEVMDTLSKARDRAKAAYDAKHDEVMPRYGGMSIRDVDERRKQIKEQARSGAAERARTNGYMLDDDFDPATVNSVMDPLEAAKEELSRAERKVENTTDEGYRNKYAKQAKKARQKVRAAEINARKALYGESPKEAEQHLDREAGIGRQRKRLFGSEQDPQAVIDRADQVLAERAGKVKDVTQATRERVAKLYQDLDEAETETQINEIETKIAREQAKLKQPDPLVEAATRAKRDAQRTLGIEPTAEEVVAPLAGLAPVEDEGASEAEVEERTQPEGETADGEAAASPSTAEEQDDAQAPTPVDRGERPVGETEAGITLPEEHGKYFDLTGDSSTVPVSALRPIRARPEGVANAGRFMREAYDGVKTRRPPISVRAEADGSYTVLDGNSTYANMAQAGWESAPVRVVTNEQFAQESAPKFGKKTGTMVLVEGDTIIARGPVKRRKGVEARAKKEGLKVRFEPSDAGKAVPKSDPRRRGGKASPKHLWRDALDEVGAEATVDEVEAWLAEKTPDVEYMAAFDENGKLLGFGTNDHENMVAQPALAGGVDNVTTVHNHPTDNTFSSADVATMAGPQLVTASRIVTPSGVFEMRPTGRLTGMTFKQAQTVVGQAFDEVTEAISSVDPGRDKPALSSPRVRQEAMLRIMDADGLIDYTVPFGPYTEQEENLINELTDAVFDARDRGTSRDEGVRNDVGTGTAPGGQDGQAGGGRAAAATGSPGAQPQESIAQTKARWKAESVAAFPTVDAVLEAAKRNDPVLREFGETVTGKTRMQFLGGPIKTRDSIERKLAKKKAAPGALGDVIRGGFVVDTPADTDSVLRQIEANAAEAGMEVLVEPWSVTDAGYVDRAVVLRMPDGQLAEIQIWPRHMLMAKEGINPNTKTKLDDPGFTPGHKDYEIARDDAVPQAQRDAATKRMRTLYASALALSDPGIQQIAQEADPSLLSEADPELNQKIQAAMAQRVVAAVDLRTGADTLQNYGLPPGNKHKTRDIAAALEERQRTLHGVIKRGDFSDEAKAKIADWMSEEVQFELALAKAGCDSGAGWYGEKFQRALDTFSQVYPELGRTQTDMQGTAFATPQEARDYLTALIAVTSDGEKVYTNFKRAMQAYGEARVSGVIPTNVEAMRGASMRTNFDTINRLRAEHGDGMKSYLLDEFTVYEINRQLRATGQKPMTKYQAHMVMPRAAVAFGPKLGAFYANLSGADGYLTMDRWWSRTFNRYRGTLLPKPTTQGMARLRQLIAEAEGISPNMPRARLMAKAERYANNYKAKGYKNGTEIERAAKTVWKAEAEELNDVPFNAKDRTFMIESVKAAQEQLRGRGVDTNVADIQAMLWYYEKRLYAEMGARATPDISYEEVAHRVVNETTDPDGGAGDPGPGAGEPVLRGPDGADVGTRHEGPGIGDDEVRLAASSDRGRDGGADAGGTRGGSRRLAGGGLAPLEGAPTLRGHKGPIQDLVRVAEDYARSIGIELVPQGEFVEVDPARAKRIADAYEAMPHAPGDPKVKEAYDDLVRQTRAQYDALAAAGYRFGFYAPDSPYGNSPVNAMEDIRLNKRMLIFPTDSGFGTSDFDPSENPLLADTGLKWPDEQGNLQTVYANDLFRAVHDAFGHGLEGSGFRAKGEENAWQAHIRLFTGPAKGAITSETRGQNSWLNYGPHAERNQTAAVEDTIFADQKTGLMPEWTWTEGLAPDAPDAVDSVMGGQKTAVPGEPTPLYVSRDVVDDGGLRKWATDNGLTGVLPMNEMHLTVTYSRDPVDVADAPARDTGRSARATGELAMLGSDNDTLVMKLGKAGLQQDHNRYRKAGASHDYGDSYTPHITLKYDTTDADLEMLRAAPKFTGQIKLGPETQSKLKPRPEDTQPDRVALDDFLLSEDGISTATAAGPDAKITDAPVDVTRTPDGRTYLVNGYHRYLAAKRRGDKDIAVQWTPFDKVAILYDMERSFTDGTTPVKHSYGDERVAFSQDIERVSGQVRDVLANRDVKAPIALTRTPPVLRALLGKDQPVVLPKGVVWKANADKHGLLPQEITDAMDGLYEPIMVFDSDTQPGGIVAMTSVDRNGRPVVVAIHPNAKLGRMEISRVASIHAKDRPQAITNWIRNGLRRYVDDQKAAAWGRSSGLQLPTDGTPTRRAGKVLRHRDVFKGDDSNNVAGERIAASVDSPEFKRWFGDSKVVDENGKPLQVYHGTPTAFEAFDPAKVGSRDGGFYGQGFYATPDLGMAEEFAYDDQAGVEGDTMDLYAAIKNPFVFDLSEEGIDGTRTRLEALLRAKLRNQSDFYITFNLVGDEPRKFTAAAKAAGFDGVIVNRNGEIDEVVAFEPAQLKSVGNAGTWSADDPRIAAAVDMPDYIDSGYHPKTHETMKQVMNAVRNPGALTRTWAAKLEDNLFNGFAPIRRLEQAVTGKLAEGAESAYKAAEMAVNDSGRSEALLYYGAAKLGQHGEFTVAPGTKGLRTIFDEVAASTGKKRDPQALADWMAYMAAKRAEGLHARGIATPLSDADIQRALAKETPAFKQAAADWKAHNDANIDFLVDTGRITPAQATAMKAEEHYVPFYRSTDQMSDGSAPDFSLDDYLGVARAGRPGSGALLRRDPGIHRIVGGDRQAIDNLMLNMIRNGQSMVAAGMRNQAANQTFDLMEQAGMARTVKATKVSKKTGNIVRREKPANSVRMWLNGKEKFVVVDEAGAPLVAALGGLHPRQRGAIENIAVSIAAIFRQGITLSPAFMIRNAIRGAVSTGLLTSGSNLTASNNFFTGFRDSLRQGDATKAFKHMSGMGDYRFGNPDVGFGKEDILIGYGLAPKTIMSRLRGALDRAEKVGTATELADRVAAFNTLQKNGVRADEAAYQALTIMNYGRRGNNTAVRVMLPMIPFLNARLQGLSRLAEGSIGRRGAVARKQALTQLAINGALLSMASLALWGWNNEDEEKREKYLAEPTYRKLNYHIVYAGDRTLYIPKAFELGALFSSLPEMAMDAVANDMGEQFLPGVAEIMKQTFLFNAIPAAFLPAIEVSTNHSYFRDAPIEGMRETGLRARDRVTGASPLSIFLGQQLGLSDATNMSPVQMEHILQGYGGAYYHLLSAATEIAGGDLGMIPQTPAGALGTTPVISPMMERAMGSLVKSTPQNTNKYLGEFYDTKTYVDRIYQSAKEAATNGDVEYARHLLSQVSGLEPARKLLNKVAPKLSDLNAAIRVTRMDKNLTRRQKADRLEPLIKARNALSEKVVDIVRQIEQQQGVRFKQVA